MKTTKLFLSSVLILSSFLINAQIDLSNDFIFTSENLVIVESGDFLDRSVETFGMREKNYVVISFINYGSQTYTITKELDGVLFMDDFNGVNFFLLKIDNNMILGFMDDDKTYIIKDIIDETDFIYSIKKNS